MVTPLVCWEVEGRDFAVPVMKTGLPSGYIFLPAPSVRDTSCPLESKVGMMTRPEESVSIWYAQRGRAQIKEKRRTVRRTSNFRFILYLLLMCKMGCCSHFYLRSRPGTVEQIPLKVS